MNALSVYIVESIACAGLAYLIYEVLLRNLKSFVFNRTYLLLALTLSLLAPALHVESPELVKYTVLQTELTKQLVSAGNVQDEFTGELIRMSPFEMFSTFHMVALIYLCVTAFFLIQFVVSLTNIFIRLEKNGPRFRNMRIVYTNEVNPHSFFNYLFINGSRNDDLNKNILIHESAHGRQFHSIDILFSTLISAFFWFNPFVWLIKRAIAENHEYLADDFALSQLSEREKYAQSILDIEDVRTPVQLTSHFSYKLTKNRINMIFRNNPHPLKRWISISLSLLLVSILFTISACKVPVTEKRLVVVVDAGHGGKDHGVKLAHDSEKDINMAIAKKMEELAKYSNVYVVLTRGDDEYISIDDRCNSANAIQPDLFLSIHASQAESSKNGIEIYVSNREKVNKKSEEFGKHLYSRLDAFEDAPVTLKSADFKILKNANCPTVLVGVGFMSNADDLQKLRNEDYQHQLAYELLQAIDGA